MSKTHPTAPGALDPVMLARLLVQPDVAELVSAFALIPPGNLRQTIIDHAKALAEAYSNAPAAQRFPDPLPAALGHAQAPRALPRRSEHEPHTDDPRTKAVQMRLEGKQPWQIAKATGLKVSTVYAAVTDARKAGVSFPKIGRASPGKNNKYSRAAVYATTVEEVAEGRAMGAVARAAEKRGIDVEAYMGRRKLALDMALAGHHFREIMEAAKEDRMTLGTWFSTARAAGHNIPYMFDAATTHFEDRNVVAPEPTPEVVDLKEERQKRYPRKQGIFIMSEEQVGRAGIALIDKAAASLGVSRAGYFNLRAKAVTLYESGKQPAEVARAVGISKKQAQNWRDRALAAGVLKQA